MAAEIDGVERFPRADKLCCYAGLVPTTHSCGGKTSHGRMMPFANRWLKWAFIEAAWVAVGCSCTTGVTFRQSTQTHLVLGCSVQRLTSVHPLRLGSVWRAGDLIDYYVRLGLTARH
jgi:hypothetical protein